MPTNGTEQQIIDYLGKAKRFLIALPQNLNGDAMGAGLALAAFSRKLQKDVTLASAASTPAVLRFLPGADTLKGEISASATFVVSLGTTRVPLGELSYEQHEGRVDILLKPKAGAGNFSAQDISFRPGKAPYDLIVTLDTPSLEHLGAIYEKNTDLFFETPIVNIDHHPNNENYGQINYVDLTATSTAEILTALIENYDKTLLDEDMATCLLAGLIVETNSFQHVRTTPRSFLKASALVSAGARQQEIVRELYKTKNVPLLKLWGRALARIKELPELGLTYSLLAASDLEKSGAKKEDILPVMRELVGSLAGRKIVILLCETETAGVTGYFHLHPSLRAQVVASALGGVMLNGALGRFQREGLSLLDAEKEVLEKLQKIKSQLAPQ